MILIHKLPDLFQRWKMMNFLSYFLKKWTFNKLWCQLKIIILLLLENDYVIYHFITWLHVVLHNNKKRQVIVLVTFVFETRAKFTRGS